MLKSIAPWLLLAISACAPVATLPSTPAVANDAAAAPADTLDLAARDYVALQMAIGEKEEGYIDAYYGPDALRAEGKRIAAENDLPALRGRVAAIAARVDVLSAALAGDDARRAKFLLANLTAADTRLRMLSGEKLSFDAEALGLFGLRPTFAPLSSYDPALAAIERMFPGKGELWQRVDAFQEKFVIPTARLKPVFDAAIAQCKARTAQHIALPPGERFDLAFVTGKSWGGYNYYQGDYHSKIEVNTDLPVRISRAVDLGCHEGYPGHHVLNSLLEQRLTRGKGWVEFSVYPLFSPQSVIAEGSANYGINIAFPGPEKLAYEKATLYPLAGLSTANAAKFEKLMDLAKDLRLAGTAIQRDFLDGRIDEVEAVRLYQRYMLVSADRAQKQIDFAKQYRSYILNYGLGEDLIRRDVESRATPAERWQRFEQIISEPTLPSDLKG